VSRLDLSPRQRDPLADPFQLTKVNEAAHENSRSRARTNCEPTRAFVPLSSHPSEDRPRVTRSAHTTRARMISAKSRETDFEAMSLQLEDHTGRGVGGRQYGTSEDIETLQSQNNPSPA
jgi:hypothetical protein